MHPVLVYLLKMVICSSILFAYYRFALYNKKFHVWNRFYLLAITGVSILAPFIEIPILETSRPEFRQVATAMPWHIESVYIIDNSTPAISTDSQGTIAYHQPTLLDNLKQIPISDVITFLYITICVFFFAKLLAEILRLNKLYKHSPGAPYIEKVEFVITELKNAPFSFFNRLYWRSDINPTDITGKRILKHEMVHINEKHSYDKLFMNIVLAIFWINPVFWLIRKELSMIHEFLADSQSVEEHDGDAFARMILQVVNVKHSPITNPFFSSQIKRRLQMITTSTQSKYSYLRRIAGLALLASATFSVMLTVSQSHAQKSKDEKELKSKSATVKNINSTDSIFINNVYIDKLLPQDKLNAIKKDSVINIRIKSAANTDSATSVDLQVATIDMDNMTRSFKAKVIGDSNQVAFVNGSVVFAGLDKKNIAELKVELSNLKDKLLFSLDSQKIVFKNSGNDFNVNWARGLKGLKEEGSLKKEKARLKVSGLRSLSSNSFYFDSTNSKFIINGISINLDSALKSEGISEESLDFKKSKIALEKAFASINVDTRLRGKVSLNEGDQPLYIVDGFPITGTLSSLNSDNIETVTVLKDASSTALYGDKAANGAIIVTTKKAKSGQNLPFVVQGRALNQRAKEIATVQGYAYNSKRTVSKKLKVNKSSMTYTETTVYEDSDKESQVKTIENSSKKPYYILNGRQVDRKALNNLDPQTIRNVQVYKRDHEIKRYYAPEGTDAVIVVNSKQ